MRPADAHFLHPCQAVAVVLHVADDGLYAACQVAGGNIDFFFVQGMLLIEINRVGEHDAHVEAGVVLHVGEGGVHREPCRQLVGISLIEDVGTVCPGSSRALMAESST